MKAGIAGAGIVGRLLAWQLLQAGWEVSLFDPGNLSCSEAAAGLLTPVSELDKSAFLIYELGKKSLEQYWPAIIDELNVPIYFRQLGSLAVSHPKEQADLEHYIHRIQSHSTQKLPTANSLVISHSAKILEPELEKFNETYYFPTEGQIDSQQIFLALGNAVTDNWLRKSVDQVLPGKIMTESTIHHFDITFDCRGLGAKLSTLRGVRGELIWLYADAVNITRPVRFLHPRYSLYVVPRPDHVYLIGASEIEAEDFSPISVKTTLELLTAAYYLHPGFSEARIIKTVVQCRPAFANHLPKIQFKNGYIAINGLYRHGYLISPTLINDVMLYLKNGFSSVAYPKIWEEVA